MAQGAVKVDDAATQIQGHISNLRAALQGFELDVDLTHGVLLPFALRR
jgi:hypothetical protein